MHTSSSLLCFYGSKVCEEKKIHFIWFLTGSKLRVFEKRVLRKIFGPKSSEVTREWGRIDNE
jgi:hypothetical protein